MSKVDLNVFQEFAVENNYAGVDNEFLYALFANELSTTLSRKYDYAAIEGDYGGEGEGEHCYGVIRFQGKYYKAEWSYYSYNGCEYDYIANTVKEVFPKEKTITVYE